MDPTPEEQARQRSLHDALDTYHANPGQYNLPELGADNRWHLVPSRPPPMITGGFVGDPLTTPSCPPRDEVWMRKVKQAHGTPEAREHRAGVLKQQWQDRDTKDWITVKK